MNSLLRGFFLGLSLPGLALAESAEPVRLSLASIFTDKVFEEEKMEEVLWSEAGAHYFTLEKPAEGKLGKDLIRYEAATGRRETLATAQELTPEGAKAPLTVAQVRFNAEETLALLFANTRKVWRENTRGDYWLLDLKTKALKRLGGEAAASTLMYAKFSPDSSCVAYMRQNNVYVERLADGKITPVTTDGSELVINGGSDWVNEEELGLSDGFRWSEDGTRLLFWQFDTREVKRFWLVNQTEGAYQSFTTFPYPKVGAKNSACRLGVVRATGGPVTWLKVPGDPREHYLPAAGWTPGDASVWVQQFNRPQNTLVVYRCDPASGEAKPLMAETDPAWVENRNTEPRWLGKDFLWFSERAGWRQIWRVTLEGQVQAVTPEGHDVIEMVALDSKGGWLYYLASPDDATQRYLHRASLDGMEDQRLTPADQTGTHRYECAAQGAWAVHTWSSFTRPPVVDLVTLPRHESVRVLKSQAKLKERLSQLPPPKTEFLQVEIGEGVTADAWMMQPHDLDTTKRYPLLMHVYGEPAGQTVRDVWGGQRTLWHWMLTEQGFVVASVDTRGTPAPKGREWRKAVHRQLGVLNSQEQAAALRSLLARFAFLDPKRVGIWGWSGGGSSSLNALFRYPELYRTAIAVAPVADRRLYDSIYEERYMGLLADNLPGYTEGSPITHVSRLQGDLLLIHGTGDDNVHYQATEKLIDALVALNKPFTVMPYPNRDHSINTGKGISRHLYELMTSWLQRHLMQP